MRFNHFIIMAISRKNKIRLGALFLFLLLLLLGGFSIFQITKLTNESAKIIKANYETLEYCHNMQRQLDSIQLGFKSSIETFDNYLKHQENNITERGEENATMLLRQAFD